MGKPDRETEWRERFVNDVGHALKGPISAVRAHLDAMGRRLRRGDEPGPTLERLEREVARLERALENMLLYGRPLELEPGPVELQPFLGELAQAFRSGTAEPQAEVEFQAANAPARARWDRRRLTIALQRIVENAVQHTEAPHHIVLRAEAGPPGVILSVSDHGAGIPEERLGRVLEPFYPQLKGRPGLGLAVADKLVRAHGGRIEVSSEPGHGTTVRLLLPLEPPTSP